MNTLKKVALVTIIGLGLVGTTASADNITKGKKLYQKHLKEGCGFTGAVMAAKHTQDEWEEIKEEGKLKEEIQKLCPNVEKTDEKALKDKFMPFYYEFFYNFASDSGNIPSC